jgi:hypothetical protein
LTFAYFPCIEPVRAVFKYNSRFPRYDFGQIFGLLGAESAYRIDDDTAIFADFYSRTQQRELFFAQSARSLRSHAVFQFRVPPKGSHAGAGRVEQNAVEGAFEGQRVGVRNGQANVFKLELSMFS